MTPGDLERVLEWRNHPDVRRYMYTRHEIGLREHRAWFARSTQDPSKRLMVFDVGDMPTGFVSLASCSQGRIADWGFYLSPDAPRGSGRELGQAALDCAFLEMELHKVCGQALAFNEKSIRFHKRLGFVQEGLLRDQHFDGCGFHSVVCFGMLRQEWQPELGAIN
ncbi:UDP-4-amino-4,6-dideoxy-N-acetyl-beta-L-altrosamine N-acetyltransferase [Salinisphaera dokdonensis]